MHKLKAAIHKEILLLSKDLGGVVILFVMPIVLIITITLIQDSTFKSVEDIQIPIALVDRDKGAISKAVLEGMQQEGSFRIDTLSDESQLQKAVHEGTYQIGIVIPAALSNSVEESVTNNVQHIVEQFMGEESPAESPSTAPSEITLYFDPTTQSSFKTAVKNQIDKMMYQIETASIYKAFQEQLSDTEAPVFKRENLISFKEVSPSSDPLALPNSVQHNVPAWTLFAIFFIIVPLSINMVKEKNQGTYIRLRSSPVSYLTLIGGKITVYLGVCLIQCLFMLLIGMYLFPSMGLPALEVTGKILPLVCVTLCAGLAAIGLGILLGTLAKTQEQSAPFGATFVVILAAMGGVWVPVFIMPPLMQHLAVISPMNWGLTAFYNVFLRNAGFSGIYLQCLGLLVFFMATTLIAVQYNEKKNDR